MSEDKLSKITETLEVMQKQIDSLQKRVHKLEEHVEDTHLTPEERKMVNESIAKVKAGDYSDTISLEDLKKELDVY